MHNGGRLTGFVLGDTVPILSTTGMPCNLGVSSGRNSSSARHRQHLTTSLGAGGTHEMSRFNQGNSPQQGYGSPQQGYGSPQQGYGSPQQGFGACKFGPVDCCIRLGEVLTSTFLSASTTEPELDPRRMHSHPEWGPRSREQASRAWRSSKTSPR